MKLINADALRKELIEWKGQLEGLIEGKTSDLDVQRYSGRVETIMFVLDAVNDLEKKQKEGHWKLSCSECGFTVETMSRFCPDCGARMDGGEQNAAD